MESERLINFCHPVLQSTISCSTCCSEHYEETNLLSSDTAKLRRGFMVDRFIKPPVEVVITFKYPVNLSHIIIWPRVGQQKSSGFEISTCFLDNRLHTPSENAGFNSCERISYCSLSENNNGALLYCPRKFGRSDTSLVIQEAMNFAKQPFKWCKQSAITDVKNVTIKIIRTHGSSVPALGRIEVWGKPGARNWPSHKKEQWHLWKQRLQEKKTIESSEPVSERIRPEAGTSKDANATDSVVNIPEEFLDGLTFEIMCLPMVLPSGKVVDQKTLERHQDSEATWGRPPNDPFTGLSFTPSLHPVLDNTLKSRIDHFLVMHQDREELRSVPRTLGRASNNSGLKIAAANSSSPGTSGFNANRGSVKEILNISSLVRSSDRSILPNDRTGNSIVNRRMKEQPNKKLESVLPGTSKSNNSPGISTSNERKSNLATGQRTVDRARISKPNHFRKRSHSPEVEIVSENLVSNKVAKMSNGLGSASSASLSEAHSGSNGRLWFSSQSSGSKLDDSLDDALKAVLSGLPSFVNVSPSSATPPLPANCCKCEIQENLFMLPCEHLICRACLLQCTKSAQPTCWNCNRSFTSSQPLKYHA